MLALTTDRLDPAIVRTLLRHGADTTIKSARGETALDWAHKYGCRCRVRRCSAAKRAST
jgi:ankyrin repeat protein